MALEDNDVVCEFFETGLAFTAGGDRIAAHSQIPLEWAEPLYRTVLAEKPDDCLEIGLGFGASALAILSALHELERGRLTSVDPLQSTAWRGCGTATIEAAGFAARHRSIEEPSHAALPALLRDGAHIDFAYIDGWHTLDYVLLDFFYVDKLLRVGGVVGFNDCSFPAVHRVINFLLTHRRYEELDVGLPTRYVGYRRRARIKARVLGKDERLAFRSYDDRYFRKLEAWEPNWDFFAEF